MGKVVDWTVVFWPRNVGLLCYGMGIALAIFLIGCFGGADEGGSGACEPDTMVECVCLSGEMGHQQCSADGGGLIGVCECSHEGGEPESSEEGTEGHDTYVSGLEKVGMKGNFIVRLLESNPIPNYTGLYTWELEVVDADGVSVSGAMVEAEPVMPAHGHGTWPTVTVAAEESPAIYELLEMNLYMPGVWHVAIRIVGSDGTEDEVAYDFDLDG